MEVSVQDAGIGMSPEVRARAMEPFFTTKPAGKGTGLGLALVYGAMKAHGGSVELESAVGRGTRVVLRFPPSPRAEEAAGTRRPTADDVRSLRVLLVEDEASVRASTATVLRRAGHDVHAVADGNAALELLSGGLAVDVAILDQNLPGLTGMETLKRIRATTHAGLPAVVVTGLASPLLEETIAAEPGVWLLPKPFAPAELHASLRAACPGQVASRTDRAGRVEGGGRGSDGR